MSEHGRTDKRNVRALKKSREKLTKTSSEMKRNETKWNEMKWNEMKWNEMKWNEMDIEYCCPLCPMRAKYILWENIHQLLSIGSGPLYF